MKQQYTAFWGQTRIKNISGTRRTIVNRLKRSSYVDMIDSLEIYPYSDAGTDYDKSEEGVNWLTNAEMTEIKYQCSRKVAEEMSQ